MQEERRPLDPTRQMLRVFGVTVTAYEEKTARILEQATAGASAAELLGLAAQAMDLTADLDQKLREVTNTLLETQARVLAQVKAALDRAQAS